MGGKRVLDKFTKQAKHSAIKKYASVSISYNFLSANR